MISRLVLNVMSNTSQIKETKLHGRYKDDAMFYIIADDDDD